MPKAIIIHGSKGSPEGNWFPWLAEKLSQHGYTTYVPRMPTPEGQSLSSWREAFNDQVGILESDSIVIGHSTGALFVLRLLESIKEPINTAVVVAGLTKKIGLPEYDNLNTTFINHPFNWAKIRCNASHFICFSGDNDPYVPLSQGQEIADGVGARLITIHDGGHLNSESGYSQFPEILDQILNQNDF